jgi:hypothetical protein
MAPGIQHDEWRNRRRHLDLRRARGDGDAGGLEQPHEPIHRLPFEKCQTLPSMLALPTTHPRYVSSSSIALACFKSNVSKPSVNQP